MANGNPGSDQYFVEVNGQRYGPVGLEQLKRWVMEGRVERQTDLIESVSENRIKAESLPDLFAVSTTPPVQAPPAKARPAPSAPVTPLFAQSAPVKKGWPVWAILLAVFGGMGVLCCPILAAIVIPVFAQARVAAHEAKAVTNLKQLAIGVLLYSEDNDDAFPARLDTALQTQPYLSPYVMDKGIFKSLNPDGGQILGNRVLSNHLVTAVAAPRQTVLFFDEKPWRPSWALASFVDGHAARSPFMQLQALLSVNPFPPIPQESPVQVAPPADVGADAGSVPNTPTSPDTGSSPVPGNYPNQDSVPNPAYPPDSGSGADGGAPQQNGANDGSQG
ncbi:MAG TPA: DUF4339 domain-containing protein [Fimbriimonas sp.]|nr:DUF4339 domain-containing protein [Fimbriimonas sp.]